MQEARVAVAIKPHHHHQHPMPPPPVLEEQEEHLRPMSSTDAALSAAYAGDDPASLTPARRWYLANQSVEANPGVPGGFVIRAVAFLAMGRPWEAVADLDRALRFAIRDATTTRCDRRSADDEEARIRLLRGHAHTACLSYDRAAADFTTAAEILEALEESDEDPPDGGERATSAHARAGLGVCYCHMRRWSDAIRAGEAAIAELAYDDIARTHVSRAVETARQHLAMERRGGGATATLPFHEDPLPDRFVVKPPEQRPTKRVLLAAKQSPAMSPARQKHRVSSEPPPLPDHQPPPDHDNKLSLRRQDNSSMSMSSLPKNLSIASIAMSLSMASICSDNWELGGETSPPPHSDEKRPSADDDDNVGLHLDDAWQPAAPNI